MAGRPCAVGLTGGLASGKSSVAVMLARRGAEVLDAVFDRAAIGLSAEMLGTFEEALPGGNHDRDQNHRN